MNPPRHPAPLPNWLIVVAAVVAALGLWLGQRYFAAPVPSRLANAVLYPSPRPIVDFRLTRTDAQSLTTSDWHGHWSVVYFGYTHCPDVCPTALATFAKVWKDLHARGLSEHVRFYFISVDPQRDTPQILRRYVDLFDPDFVAATGADAELTALTRALGLIYTRTTGVNGEIQVEHSGSAVIVDPHARQVGIFRPPFAAHALAGDLATLVAGD
ncbi:MAG: SCO family protein [Rudaea sp.]